MKTKILPVLLAIFNGSILLAQNIGIGTNSPHVSAQLEISAANKGLLIPRMALANRPASPAIGLLIYQTNSTPGFYYYDGIAWLALKTPDFSLPYSGSTVSANAFAISSSGGNAIVGQSDAPGNFAGGYFSSAGVTGYGAYVSASHPTGANTGLYATTPSSAGVGVWGRAESETGTTYGIRAQSNSTQGTGIKAFATAATGNTLGVDGQTNSTTGIGIYGFGTSATGANYGVYGGTLSPSGYGGYFRNFGGGAGVALATGSGEVEFLTLAGAGNRMVLATSAGRLISQAQQWITNGNNIYNGNIGKVGIGISAPAATLQVNESIDAGVLITNDITGYSLFDGLRLRMNSTTASIQNSENSDLFLQTNSGATGAYGTPAIWIKPSGAIGIGTSTPGAKLEILSTGASQPALNINNGFLKVSGSNKTAFTITGNISNSSAHTLTLNYANQSATDILIVTHNYNPPGEGTYYHNSAVGVYWTGTAWAVYSEDIVTPMFGKSFNVLVIKQ